MKRTYLNLALALLVLAVGAALYFTRSKPPAAKPPLTSLEPAQIDHIVIAHPKAKPVVLERRGARWRLTQPVSVAADPYEVNSVLDLARLPREETLPLKGLKLSELGLDPPRYTVKLNDVTIKVGEVEPLRYRRYMQVGDTVALVDNPPSAALGSDYADLVSKTLVPAGARIEKIELPGVTVGRSADGKGWQITPADPHAAADAADRLATAWSEASAMWTKLAPKDAKLPTDAATVTIDLSGRPALHFVVVKRDPQLVLQRDDIGIRYALGKDQADKLLKLAAAKSAKPAAASTAAKPAERPARR